jgi:hypothetical protein
LLTVADLVPFVAVKVITKGFEHGTSECNTNSDFVGFTAVLVVPSPKFHKYESALVDVLVKVNISPLASVSFGEIVKLDTGFADSSFLQDANNTVANNATIANSFVVVFSF